MLITRLTMIDKGNSFLRETSFICTTLLLDTIICIHLFTCGVLSARSFFMPFGSASESSKRFALLPFSAPGFKIERKN